MRAHICDPNDEKAVERFKATLTALGAVASDKNWTPLGDILKLTIGDQNLTVFNDSWSIDIEGPNDLVQRIAAECKN